MPLRRKEISAENALTRLENMCVRAEHCEGELRAKLRQWQLPASEAERILKSLKERRFYDDSRFASAFVRDKLFFGRWGRRRIAMALAVKGVSRDIADEALSEISEEDYASALYGVLRAKARGIKEGNTFEGRTKLFRSVVACGFEPGLVASFMRKDDVWPAADTLDESDE